MQLDAIVSPSQQTGRARFAAARRFLNLSAAALRRLPVQTRSALLASTRFIPGTPGLAIRYVVVKSLARSCGDNVSIHAGAYILSPANLAIGHNVSIHPFCYIDATGGLQIGDNVSIAHGTSILSTTHTYDDLRTPIKYQPIAAQPTVVANDVWLGAKSTVLGGTAIGEGSVIAAGAVVTKDVSPLSIVAGVPARTIKIRSGL